MQYVNPNLSLHTTLIGSRNPKGLDIYPELAMEGVGEINDG